LEVRETIIRTSPLQVRDELKKEGGETTGVYQGKMENLFRENGALESPRSREKRSGHPEILEGIRILSFEHEGGGVRGKKQPHQKPPSREIATVRFFYS